MLNQIQKDPLQNNKQIKVYLEKLVTCFVDFC